MGACRRLPAARDTRRVSTERDARRSADTIWVAWLVAGAVIVVLTVNVVRHLTAPQHVHMPASDALFRAGSSPLGSLLSHRLVTAWNVDAVALAVLAGLGAWYVTAVVRRRRRTGTRWPVARTVSFAAGIAVCAYATSGAIAVYDKALFSAHMLGHLALVMVAPALFAAGSPLRLAVDAGSERVERIAQGNVVTFLTAPPVALACYAGVIVGSHLTGLMDTIMRSTAAGQLEHLVYLVVGYQFFILVIGDEPIRWRLSTPARWGLLALAMAVDTFTGVTLMMSSTAVAMSPPASLAVDPLTDTHTGGAIMWFGGDGIMAVVMIALVIGWQHTSGRSLRDRASWMERARAAALSDRAGGGGDSDSDIDDDDARLDAYNAWLAQVSERDRPQ